MGLISNCYMALRHESHQKLLGLRTRPVTTQTWLQVAACSTLGSFTCAQRKPQRKAQDTVHGLCSRHHAWAILYTLHLVTKSTRPTSSVFCKAFVSLMRHLTTRSLNLVRMSWPCCCNCSGGQRSKTMRARKEYVLQQKKKDFTRSCQPTQPITCANHGNHVQIIMQSRRSTT